MAWFSAVLDELLAVRVPLRRGRCGPRGVKRKMSGYPIRRSRGPTFRQTPIPNHLKRTK